MAYSGAITLDATTTIKAKVFSDSYFDSEVVLVTFVREQEQVATPEIAVATTFTGSKTKCEIVCTTEGAKIYYTLDTSTPNAGSWCGGPGTAVFVNLVYGPKTLTACAVVNDKAQSVRSITLYDGHAYVRDGIVLYEGKIGSLKRFKDDVREVAAGYECGMSVEKYNDIKEGDVFEAFTMEEVEA